MVGGLFVVFVECCLFVSVCVCCVCVGVLGVWFGLCVCVWCVCVCVWCVCVSVLVQLLLELQSEEYVRYVLTEIHTQVRRQHVWHTHTPAESPFSKTVFVLQAGFVWNYCICIVSCGEWERLCFFLPACMSVVVLFVNLFFVAG